MECENIKSISFPKNLTTVKSGAFNDCKKLEQVKFNKKLKKIGSYAFSNTNIKTYNVPKNVNTIGSHAFGFNRYFNEQTSNNYYIKKSGIKIKGSNKATKQYKSKYKF